MGNWSKQERFRALLSGEMADRPAISGWRHFIDKEQTAEALAEVTVQFARDYDWDWIKINPRATYYAETWGTQFDFSDYHDVFPLMTDHPVKKGQDLWKIETKKTAECKPLVEQLDAVHRIREGLPSTPLLQTMFSPLTVLLFLAGRSSYVNGTCYGSTQKISFDALFSENRAAVHHALHAIAETLADYTMELEKSGADGLFYAVTGTAHEALFDEAAFNEFSRPYDLMVLDALSDNSRTILHTCGPYANPERFNDYPVDGLNWDTYEEGNALLDTSLRHTAVGGVDHRLFAVNDQSRIVSEARHAVEQMKDKPFLLAPSCSIPITVEDSTMSAFRNTI